MLTGPEMAILLQLLSSVDASGHTVCIDTKYGTQCTVEYESDIPPRWERRTLNRGQLSPVALITPGLKWRLECGGRETSAVGQCCSAESDETSEPVWICLQDYGISFWEASQRVSFIPEE